jgi:hypothetical protein
VRVLTDGTSRPKKAALRQLALVGLMTVAGNAAFAQTLPSAPISLDHGRATIDGIVSATLAPDDSGYFNYTDYDLSLLRMLQVDLAGAVTAGDHVTLLGSVRFQNANSPLPLAAYVRFRPWVRRSFDIQAGHIPPTFGSFSRRAYASDNPLIGEPLGYQYLTSLRYDALPASADELLNMRGRGWLSSFSLGDQTPAHGLPLVSDSRWDTGVQAHLAGASIDATGAVTLGSLSNPLFVDDNGGKQLIGRVSVHPSPSLVLGLSVARGAFVSADAARAVDRSGTGRSLTQTAGGADLEYSKGYVLVRAETIFTQWTIAAAESPTLGSPLQALASWVEGRYKIAPGIYAAARVDHLGFSEMSGTSRRDTWDAPVTRIELGGGYSIERNLLVKLAYQHNARDGGRMRTSDLVAVQLLFWL